MNIEPSPTDRPGNQFDHLRASDVRGKIASPTGFLVSFIRDNVPVPEDFPTTGRQRRREEDKISELELQDRYHVYQQHQVRQYMDQHLSPAEREAMRQQNAQMWNGMPEKQREDMTEFSMFTALVESGKVPMLSFADWRKQESKKPS